MIYWSDRMMWSMACVLSGLYGIDRAVEEYVANGPSSPWVWFHALGLPAMIFGVVRAWVVRP